MMLYKSQHKLAHSVGYIIIIINMIKECLL